ncbi:LAQU0S01e00452g1_1 [Lachancea quebecensis]|uniref:Conserved oligomeric Golgi complex subunit 8 n=1 Tax=Lachancea quebecensis TaxID=1654605 RepID=A0A0P1KNM4_9SACH|nr:LAQU0S01e00452g1_1 [Lachancea quebecensis]
MDALEILLDGLPVPPTRVQDAREFLSQALQSKETYEAYFSSQPLPGSIVEDIAEVDAETAKIERELKGILLENKVEICDALVGEPIEPQLSTMLSEIEKLWELEKEEPGEDQDPVLAGLDEPEAAAESEDAFHTALRKLRLDAASKSDHSADDNLALVLSNLTRINELLELPALTSTCIKTGHYQEALLCHSHARKLTSKFPNVDTVRQIADSISQEITTTMLQGLVKMLSHNISANPMKKILTFLSSIPPFSSNPQTLIQVFLIMRHKFVCTEMASFQVLETVNDTMRELLVKRKIEAFREHVYSALSVVPSMFDVPTQMITVPLLGSPKKELKTCPLMLQFVESCCDELLKELSPHIELLSDSVCLQLVYCSFRLADCNANYHHLFIDKIQEAGLYSTTQLATAMDKRRELASKYY